MKINGADLMAFTNVNDGGEDVSKLKSVAYATGHTLDITMNTVDTSTKDDGAGIWSDSEPGLLDWQVQTNNLMSDKAADGSSFNDLIDAMIARKPIKIAFGLQGNQKDYTAKELAGFKVPKGGWTPDPSNHYYGNVLITSINVTGNNGEKATATATFKGCGPLKKTGEGIVTAAMAAQLAAQAIAPVKAETQIETATAKK